MLIYTLEVETTKLRVLFFEKYASPICLGTLQSLSRSKFTQQFTKRLLLKWSRKIATKCPEIIVYLKAIFVIYIYRVLFYCIGGGFSNNIKY